jgi:hypothetical protein
MVFIVISLLNNISESVVPKWGYEYILLIFLQIPELKLTVWHDALVSAMATAFPYVGGEVLTTVTMYLLTILWDVLLCLLPASCWFLAWLTLRP